MKRVALYARVSSDQQEREETIASQLVHLRRLAAEKELTVLDRHIYLDEGYSGGLLARPGLDRLRDDVRDGLLDVVLIHCPDRLARRYAYQVVVIEEMQRYGCEVDFVNREIARTPEDQMLLAMQGVIAEYERAKMMERTRRGRLHKLRSGILIMPNPPFGYRWVPRQGAERGRIEVVPERAELVRQIFRWVAEDGLPILSVSRRLMAKSIPAPMGGHRWGTSTLQNILCNRAYIGEFCMNRLMAVEPKTPPKSGNYRRRRNCACQPRPREEWIIVKGPAVVDRKQFEAVQRQLEQNKRFARRRARHDQPFLLRCLLKCGCCGYSIIANWNQPRGPKGRVFRYYLCLKRSQSRRYGDCVTKCSLKPLKAEVLDKLVWKDVCELMSDPERIARYAGLDTNTSRQPLQVEVKRLRRQVQELDQQVQRLLDAYQQGALEVDDLLARRRKIDAHRRFLTDDLKQTEMTLRDDKVRQSIREQLPGLVAQIKKGLESTDFSSRQRLVRLLVERIVVHSTHEIEIHYVLPGRDGLPWDHPSPDESQSDKSLPVPNSVVSGNFRLHSERQ